MNLLHTFFGIISDGGVSVKNAKGRRCCDALFNIPLALKESVLGKN